MGCICGQIALVFEFHGQYPPSSQQKGWPIAASAAARRCHTVAPMNGPSAFHKAAFVRVLAQPFMFAGKMTPFPPR